MITLLETSCLQLASVGTSSVATKRGGLLGL